MNCKRTVALLVTMGILLLGTSQVTGQQDEPQSPQGTYGSAFTYQGQLKGPSGLVNGECDLRFKLWEAASGGNQVGWTWLSEGVDVVDGLFTVHLDFGEGAFQGDERWLAIEVRCPAGSGDYVTLGPRQALTAAPYALALPGLWTQPNATSPNLIGGWSGNSVTAGVAGASIGGGGMEGAINGVYGNYGVVGGGVGNAAYGELSTVGGGDHNTAGYLATVAGGDYNHAEGDYSVVAGGDANHAALNHTFIGGGALNYAGGPMSVIGGGESISVTGIAATVAGGSHITVTADYAAVGGGYQNTASGPSSTVGGGYDNTASGMVSTVAGGDTNYATNEGSTVCGGFSNTVTGLAATICGGNNNTASKANATIAGGEFCTADGDYATVGGGLNNTASGGAATVGGGLNNTASSGAATVGGGYGNTASGPDDTVGGGVQNTASGYAATISGGYHITVTADYAAVGGGYQNTASGGSSTVGGGWTNTASGNAATVPGGAENVAGGGYSFAAGAQAHATHDGSFVWSSATATDSWGTQTFTVRSHGGARFYSAAGTATGVQLSAGGTSFGSISDRNAKEAFAPVDTARLLEVLASMPVQTWNLKSQSPEMRHIGPVAQDFNGSFAYLFGEVESPIHINNMDAVGISLAASQGLYEQVQALEVENAALRDQLGDLEARLAALEGGQGASGTPARLPFGWLLLGGGVVVAVGAVVGRRAWGGGR